MIPRVKNWIITLENGRKIEVLAPTKFLAKLNLRFDETNPCFAPIKSIRLKRGLI